MRRCPRCCNPLVRRHVGGDPREASVELCSGCGGVMLGERDGRRLPGVARPVASWWAEAGLDCPHCRLPMQWQLAEAASAQWLACPGHGVWFDCFELAALRRPAREPPRFEGPRALERAVDLALDLLATLV